MTIYKSCAFESIQICHAMVSLARVLLPQCALSLSAESHETGVSCGTKITRERRICRWHWSAMLGLVDNEKSVQLSRSEDERTCVEQITVRKE